MEDEVKEVKEEVKETPEQKENSIVETIIQNGVSKEELAEMLKDILGKEDPNANQAAVEAAEAEYFSSHLKY